MRKNEGFIKSRKKRKKKSNELKLPMDESESKVAEILVELPRLIFQFESRSKLSFTWGAKKKRSYSSDTPSLLSSRPFVPEAIVGTVVPTCATEKSKTLSPATPLLFSPSESDEKSKRNSRRKVSFKRKREEYLKIEEELTERNNVYKEVIKNLKHYYDQQKALNLKLKTMKERTMLGLQTEPSQPKLSLNHAVEVRHQDHHQQTPYMVNGQPFIMDQTVHNNDSSHYPYSQNLSFLSSNDELFMTSNDHVGSFVIPDLNVSWGESLMIMESGQAFNPGIANKGETKALAAQARQRRIQICRSKNPSSARRV